MYSVACGHRVRPAYCEPVHLREVRRFELVGELGLGRAPFGRSSDDLVLDVGDVADEAHLEPAPLEVLPDRVVDDRGAPMPDVRDVVDGRSADVDRHAPGSRRVRSTVARCKVS